jgi:nicotinamidase-related amidase
MLNRERAILVVIDVQERLLPFIHASEDLILQCVRLVRGFHILGAPVLVTEQYRKGLGPTDDRLIEAIVNPAGVEDPLPARREPGLQGPPPRASFRPIEKMSFSCAQHSPFLEALRETGRRQALLCGIESHVCVLQTALNLVEAGYEVYLAADAVSSRSPRNLEIALRRMEQAGVRLTSVEMAVFEMLGCSGTAEFRRWSRLIR